MALIIQITSHCFTKFMMLILFSVVFYILLFIFMYVNDGRTR